MNSSDQERPTMDDDLDHAYARAHAMTDSGRGPSAAVRANVLAAAQAMAAQPGARVDVAPSLTPVAAPVAAVDRGRGHAVNLSAWRLWAGAALCAALVVGVALWRFDASRQFSGDTQLASAAPSAALEMKVVPAAPPQDLPPPPRDGAMPAPPVRLPSAPVEAATLQAATRPEPAAAKRAVRDKEVLVAQADQPLRERALALAPRTAPPSMMGAAASREPAVATAAPEAPHAEVRGNALQMSAPVGDAARVALANANASRSAPAAAKSLFEASERPLPTPLQAAADQGDVEALKKLLASPATRVDAPDATGRTALLHAVLAQQVGAVRLLMAAGADPGRADRAGLTPRAAAQTGANTEIASLVGTPP